MITLAPFFLLVFSALIVFVLSQFKINLGRLWLISMILSLLNWVLVLVFFWVMPFNTSVNDWFPVSNTFQTGFSFSLDQYSWIYVFLLSAVLLAVMFSESTRITEDYTSQNWIASFLIAAIGILISISNNILTIIVVWTVIDLVEFGIIQGTVKTSKQSLETVISFVVHLGGTIIFIFAALFSNFRSETFNFGLVPEGIGIFILLSVGLRLGVMPFNLPYTKEIPLRRGLGNMIRMTSVVSSIVVLNRFVFIFTPENNLPIIRGLVTFAIAATAILWFVSKDELDGRPFWIVGLSGFVFISMINGDPVAAISWSIVLMMTGSVLFLFSDRSKLLMLLPMFALVGMLGLPFTPNAVGWDGLIGENLFLSAINVVSCFVLMVGYLRFSFKSAKPVQENERWVWLVYPLGLLFLIVTPILIFFLSDLDWFVIGSIWISVPVFVLLITVVIFDQRVKTENQYSEWAKVLSQRVSITVADILHFDWLYKLIWGMFQFLQAILINLSKILEGHGGIIWVLVLLALLITMISPKGTP